MKKIHIVFLINDLFTNNFLSIYNIIKKDNRFKATVVACPSLATDYKSETSSDTVYNFLKKQQINCINSYDKKSKKYMDLLSLEPDYIFVSTPYDIYRPEEYSSNNLSKIAKLCSINYGANIFKGIDNIIFNNPHYKNCYFNFNSCKDEYDVSDYKDKENFKNITSKFIPVGCIKLDKYLYGDKIKLNHWQKLFGNSNNVRVVYKPRWTLENVEQLFELLEYFVNNHESQKYDVLILEHPILRSNLKSQNLLDKYELYLRKLPKNIKTYNDFDFLDYVLESDVLVHAIGSLVSEYSITNNPIIYIGKPEDLNKYGRKILDKKYYASSTKDIINLLKTIKHNKNIKFKNTKMFVPPKNMSFSEYLLDVLYNDYIAEGGVSYYKNILNSKQKEINKLKKIFLQGYFEDILDTNDEDFKVISNGLKQWDDLKNKYLSNKKD